MHANTQRPKHRVQPTPSGPSDASDDGLGWARGLCGACVVERGHPCPSGHVLGLVPRVRGEKQAPV
eukprot:5599048-Prymnesium_polylepis.1